MFNSVKGKFNKWDKARKEIEKILDSESCFPERKRKSRQLRKAELEEWYKKYNEVNHLYNICGMDTEGVDCAAYLDLNTAREQRNRLNHWRMMGDLNGILEDKYYFFRKMKEYGLPTPEIFGMVRSGRFYDGMLNPVDPEYFAEEKDFFIKDNYGSEGSYIMHVSDFAGLKAVMPKIAKGMYIFQRRIIPHKEAAKLYAGSINTIRIITVKPFGEEPAVFAKVHRIGVDKTGGVDNWSSGGIVIGIRDDGYLKEYGFHKDTYMGGRVEKHPDSGTVFKDYRVPMFEEALKLAVEAHRKLWGIFAIGWDVAVTEDGPVLVEGNCCFGASTIQVGDRPIRKEWTELFNRNYSEDIGRMNEYY